MSIKAEQLKQQIIDEYKLDDGQVRIDCAFSHNIYIDLYDILGRNCYWGIQRIGGTYQIKPVIYTLRSDTVAEYIELLTIAADIMAKLESGELG